MKMKILVLFILPFLFGGSCKKVQEEVFYTGTVKRQTSDCTSNLGKIFIIKVNSSLEYDSVYTALLPENYQTVGQSIKFKMREYDKSKGETWLCNTSIFKPIHVVIYNVDEYNNKN